MELKYFSENLNTADEVRQQLRVLVKKYHPDFVQDEKEKLKHTEIMKAINNEFEFLKNEIGKNYDKTNHKETEKYRFFDDELIKDYGFIIVALNNMSKSFPEIKIELVGCYFWLTMPSREWYKERKNDLKLVDLGFTYNLKRKKFMRSPGGKKIKTWNNKGSYKDIKNKYGHSAFKANDERKLLTV